MPYRDRRLLTMNSMPSWRQRCLLTEDDSIHPFCWTYGTGELIDELSRIDEILTLSEVLQQPTDIQGHLGVDILFEECFIDSHEMLVMLLDRVTTYWNKNAQHDILKLHKNNSLHKSNSKENMLEVDKEKQRDYFAEVMLSSYKHANNIYKDLRENLLRMRFLYEQLKPETQALVKCCSYKLQLQNSMLAQRIVQGPSKTTAFRPACGFILTPPAKVTIQDRIAVVEMQISRLQMQRDLLLNKLADEEVIRDALEVCDVLRAILDQGSAIEDSTEALQYATEIIAPQKHILERYSSSFENTLQAFPDVYPSACTQEEAAEFLLSMLDALEKDYKQLNIAKNEAS